MNRELTLEIVKEFFKDKPLIERVYLFGSFERREETENSDLDLLVDMKETINTLGVPLMKFIGINYFPKMIKI
jgi:predicted nucleotidyltransferase